jgi:hypothetical protein
MGKDRQQVLLLLSDADQQCMSVVQGTGITTLAIVLLQRFAEFLQHVIQKRLRMRSVGATRFTA